MDILHQDRGAAGKSSSQIHGADLAIPVGAKMDPQIGWIKDNAPGIIVAGNIRQGLKGSFDGRLCVAGSKLVTLSAAGAKRPSDSLVSLPCCQALTESW